MSPERTGDNDRPPAPHLELEDVEPLLHWRDLVPWLPLIGALALALIIYWPALNSGFFSDDYVYIDAVRRLSFGHYTRISLIPGSHDGVLIFAQNYWRPLYFLSFQVTDRLFGGHVLPYHLLILAIHFASTVLVWVIARRLTRSWVAAGVAALVFAVLPASVGAVSWISSINSLALPLGLGAWLAFMIAGDSVEPQTRRRRHALSLVLLVLALGFRETAIVFLAAKGAWHVCITARPRLFDWRAHVALAPYVILGVAYFLVRTKLFTEPLGNEGSYRWGSQVPENAWYYLRVGFSSWTESETARHRLLAAAPTVVMLACIPLALLARRWIPAAALVAFVASIAPNVSSTFGLGGRYFYLPSAFFAVAMGVAAAEVMNFARFIRRPAIGVALVVAAGGAASWLGVATGHQAVERWVRDNPDVQQRWVDQLRMKYPALPEGGTVYVANVPLILALFGDYALYPTVHFYYPDVAQAVRIEPADVDRVRASLGSNDRIFVYEPAVP